VIEATGSPREAASVLFYLPGYRVIDSVDDPAQFREVGDWLLLFHQGTPSP
jgi:hypothetical protein